MFFLHSLSSPHPLSLPSLKALIAEVFITRNDPRIDELAAERRAGRPKTIEHLDLEELRRREQVEFDTGFGMSILLLNSRTNRVSSAWQVLALRYCSTLVLWYLDILGLMDLVTYGGS